MTTNAEQQAKLKGYLDGFYATCVIDTGIQAGLFQALAAHPEGFTPEELASQLSLHFSYVRIWCQTAYFFDLLDWRQGLFRLAPYMDDLLGNPESPVFFSHPPAFSRHSHSLEKHSQFMKTGQIDWDHQHHSPERIEMMARTAGRVRSPFFLSSVLPHLSTAQARLQSGGCLLDVGCGSGMFLVKLFEALPNSRFSGIDINQDAVNYAKARITELGLADRVQVDVGSAEGMTFDAEFDVITMVHVFHEVEAKEAAIANCFRALKPGGQWVIIDLAYPSSISDFKKPFFKRGVLGQYSEMTSGHIHLTKKQTQALLSRAGFGQPLWKYTEEGRGLFWMAAPKP